MGESKGRNRFTANLRDKAKRRILVAKIAILALHKASPLGFLWHIEILFPPIAPQTSAPKYVSLYGRELSFFAICVAQFVGWADRKDVLLLSICSIRK
jgi:hypothetical protein